MISEAPRIIFGSVEDTHKLLQEWGRGTRWSGITEVEGQEVLVIANPEAVFMVDNFTSDNKVETHREYTAKLAGELYKSATVINK